MLKNYVALEGIDGAGKSTQIELLKYWLEQTYPDREFVFVAEPGGTRLGNALYGLLPMCQSSFAKEMLFAAARIELIETIIAPALDRGAIVISDRSYYSTIAYQGYGWGKGDEFLLDRLRRINWWIEYRLPTVLWLDLKPELAIERMSVRGKKDFFDQQNLGFFRRVRRGYQELNRSCPGNWYRFDASVSPDALKAQIREHFTSILSGDAG